MTFAEQSPNKAFNVMASADHEIYVHHNISRQGSYLPREDAKWLAESILRWIDATSEYSGDDEFGVYPAYVVIDGEEGVTIESDHNTDDYDTQLPRDEVVRLHAALGRWIRTYPEV